MSASPLAEKVILNMLVLPYFQNCCPNSSLQLCFILYFTLYFTFMSQYRQEQILLSLPLPFYRAILSFCQVLHLCFPLLISSWQVIFHFLLLDVQPWATWGILLPGVHEHCTGILWRTCQSCAWSFWLMTTDATVITKLLFAIRK